VRDWSKARRERGTVFGPNIHDFIKQQPDREGNGRALGFDVKTPDNTVFPSTAVGHLAYTGPSLWWDAENDFAWLTLCNRVHPSAGRGGITEFRQRLMSKKSL
jgi:CubicO group peptidase (beta-lactamase class C family)